MSDLHWSAAWVGQPWSPARNCWWLVQQLQRERWSREMPALQVGEGVFGWEQWRALSGLLRGTPWARVEGGALEGDVLVVRGLAGPHVGVFIDRERVLHNCGGVSPTTRQPFGSVRLEALPELLAGGYGRPEIWRHAC